MTKLDVRISKTGELIHLESERPIKCWRLKDVICNIDCAAVGFGTCTRRSDSKKVNSLSCNALPQEEPVIGMLDDVEET